MRWSRYLIPTTKEVPKDAVVASHQLMLRAGLIRQLAAGIYSYLPLGYRALRKVEEIVREEMNRAGAIELHMPVMHPIDLWQQTGRVAAMGDVLLRLRPVKEGDESDWRAQTVLGPTHEEPVTEIAGAYLNSYKNLPVNLYQIQVKFRGEARPKSGVLRTREFLMKDAYSFHRDKESLDEGYKKMYDAYCRIFSRCGLPYIAVEAESGPIGGDASHEFMVLTDAGEDFVALSENGDYAANTERAVCAPLPQDESAMKPIEEVHTPNQRTIEEVTAFLKTKPSQMIKTLVYSAITPEPGPKNAKPAPPQPPVVVLVRGDHDVNENKLNRIAGCRLELAAPDTIRKLTNAEVGFAGPHTLDQSGVPYRLIVDQAVAVMRNGATGANKTDYHAVNVNPGRDFALFGENVTVADVRTVVDGDRSPTGSGSPISLKKAIEVGHVFKLGTKYSDAMKATFLDNDGKPKPLIMGCYGIGLNRIMAAAIEAHHDDVGIIWPKSIAPFTVQIISLDPREKDVVDTAEKIYEELTAAGIDVLFDDRDERAGFKFKDADLIGIPIRITIGRKALAEGVVEVKERSGAEVEKLSPEKAAQRVRELLSN
ncbi:proline--tRNA ligase [cyanobacterium TDX16]|nr:proline--tRNA ligase [cyanobacterium TDX16]